MQLTRFDRWLRDKFVYETHIYTMHAVGFVPPWTQATDLPEQAGQRYKHRYVTRHPKAADALIHHLRSNNMMFNTQIVDRRTILARLFAPKGSFTWRCVTYAVIASSLTGATLIAKKLLDNPEIRQNLMDAFEVMKG